MDTYLKIKSLIKNDNKLKSKLLAHIEMSDTGFDKMIKLKTLKLETLVSIANFFEKPLSYFFEDNTKLSLVSEPETPYNANDFKDKYIDCLEKNIELLKKIEELNNLLNKK